MKTEKKFRERFNDFLASQRGRTIMNYCYSLGAAVVILGAMFKILHLRGGSYMLSVGMLTEVFVFIVFAFEVQHEDTKWESVFPVLKTGKDEDNYLKTIAEKGPKNGNTEGTPEIPLSVAKKLEESVNKLDQAATQLAKMAEMTDKTQSYLSKMSNVGENFEKFGNSTAQLAKISDSMADAYGSMKLNSDSVKNSYDKYSKQMISLTDNISGISAIYHEQMLAISKQIESVTKLHNELTRMASMYEGSVDNASKFKVEAENMADQLASLNSIYERMIKAMTANYTSK
ncbi:MAG: gliding motility protein GldL [Bacteroidales bacterium]|nr:gliding motility protein GldL [Bacteroidales bacterium]